MGTVADRYTAMIWSHGCKTGINELHEEVQETLNSFGKIPQSKLNEWGVNEADQIEDAGRRDDGSDQRLSFENRDLTTNDVDAWYATKEGKKEYVKYLVERDKLNGKTPN